MKRDGDLHPEPTAVGIRELKTHLSRYLKRVQAGEPILITDRGRPVGQIVPAGENAEERSRRLVQAGLISWTGRPFSPSRPKIRAQRGRSVAALLLEDRQ